MKKRKKRVFLNPFKCFVAKLSSLQQNIKNPRIAHEFFVCLLERGLGPNKRKKFDDTICLLCPHLQWGELLLCLLTRLTQTTPDRRKHNLIRNLGHFSYTSNTSYTFLIFFLYFSYTFLLLFLYSNDYSQD